MRKEVKICLYRVQDYDLYTLYFDPVFPFRDAIRLAVTAFAEGAPTPRIDVSYVERLPLRKPRYITVTFTLYSNAAIRMVEAASAHGRNANNLVKNLLRRALVGIENIYFDPEDAQYYAGRDTLSPRREPHGKPSAGGNLQQDGGRRNSTVHKTLAKDGHRQRVDGVNDGIDEGDVRDTGDVAGLLGKEQADHNRYLPVRQMWCILHRIGQKKVWIQNRKVELQRDPCRKFSRKNRRQVAAVPLLYSLEQDLTCSIL